VKQIYAQEYDLKPADSKKACTAKHALQHSRQQYPSQVVIQGRKMEGTDLPVSSKAAALFISCV
jgi:hypothetical protein